MASGQIKLTNEQCKAFDIILSGSDTFVTGGAGTGKSVLIKEVTRRLENQNKNIVLCAPTGIAAVNIKGTTIHKAFGFPKGSCITEKTHKLLIRNPKLIRMADVVVIDEVSMCRMDMMDSVCASILKAREQTGRHIQMISVGDFCQLPPVTAKLCGERAILREFYGTDVGRAFAFQAPSWRKVGFTNVELQEAVRQQDDEFIHYLNLLRMGEVSALEYFNSSASFQDDPDATKLYSRNDDVDRLNEKELVNLPGEIITFPSNYRGISTEMIYSVPSVSLKVGAKVIVTTNQSIQFCGMYRKNKNIYNGTIGTVVDARSYPNNSKEDYVIVSSRGMYYYITRKTDEIYSHRVDSEGKIYREVVGNVSYMPVKLGYVMTIHRSQGQTFDSIVLDPTCWDSGQLYVALSRLRSIDGLHLTRKITEDDVRLAPIVKEFYEHLNDPDYTPSWERHLTYMSSTQKAKVSCQDKIIKFPKRIITTSVAQPVSFRLEESTRTESVENPLLAKEKRATNVDVLDERSPDITIDTEKTAKMNAVSQEMIPNTRLLTAMEEHDVLGVSVTKTDIMKDKDANGEPSGVKKSRGRPVRFTNSSRVCRIPIELIDEIELMLQIVCPKGGLSEGELERFKNALRMGMVHKEKIAHVKKEISSEEAVARASKRGRRKRFPTGSKVCRVPVEIFEEVSSMLELICPKTGMNVDELQKFKAMFRKMCGLDI